MHIIGIEVIEGDDHILKNLKRQGEKLEDNSIFNGWYPFFSYNSGCKEIPKENSPITFDIDYNFYKLDVNSEKKISVSCIVGKNGSGKSSILELLYRIINNVGFCYQKITKYAGCDLEYEYGFKAKLYFSILEKSDGVERVGYFEINNDEKNYLIYPNGKKVCLGNVKQYEDDNKYYWQIENNDENIDLDDLEELFYSVVTNYSMYAFNPNDYKENYYPYGIFHKNDAYTTPIVLLPYRNEDGIIDIESERELAPQRLISLQLFLYKQFKISLIDNRIPLKISYKISYKNESNKYSYSNIEDNLNYLNKLVNEKYKKEIITKKIEKGQPWGDSEYNLYYEEFRKHWKNKIKILCGIEYEDLSLESDVKNRLIFYLVHKTIKICARYKLFLDIYSSRSIEETAEIIIDKIVKDDTFITLKIRQCLEFIREPLIADEKIDETNYINVNNFNKNGKNIDDYLLKLPPAIFDTDLVFTDLKNTKKTISMSSFSSGELQLLNSFSYVLYHLKNLECDKTELTKNAEFKFPDYSNVLLVFDEAELYMHPEYQRQFLYKLITAVYKCDFKRIDQIQILIATHSPYILSDIPVQNVLMLDDGEVQQKNSLVEQTFAANIYDLLQNQFFMSASIGEIAKKRINEIINFCYSEDSNKEKVNNKIKIYRPIVEKLGDNYLRESLLYMLKKKEKKDV